MPSPKTRLCFYDDNPDYGGHQVMACYGIAAFAAEPCFEVIVTYNPANTRLRARLTEIAQDTGNLRLKPTTLRTRKLQALRNHSQKAAIEDFAKELRAMQPTRLIAIQGDIEDSCQGILAARRARIPAFSYIPVPHSLALMGAKLGALRDLLNKPLFHLPDAYITISQSMEQLLRQRGATQPVHIVENGIDLTRFDNRPDAQQARQQFDLPANTPILGLIGRVEFKQKQQNFFLRALANAPELAQCHVVIGGSGPDDAALDSLIESLHLDSRVHRIPWIDGPEQLYPAFDCLVLPSRFEGVPLVMIEALACGVPVIGSDRDGMRDFLPEPWRFPVGSQPGLIQAWLNTRTTTQTLLPNLQKKVRENCSLARFQQNFLTACAP